MFAPENHNSSSKGFSERSHSSQDKELHFLRKKAVIFPRKDFAGCWAFCANSPNACRCHETLRSKHSPGEASGKALIYFNKTPSCFYHSYIRNAWERIGFVWGSGWRLCAPAAGRESIPTDATALVLTPAWADGPWTEGEESDRLNKQWFNVGYSCAVRGLSQLLPGDGCWATTDAGVADCASLQLP